MENAALVPVKKPIVQFYEDQIPVAQLDAGDLFVPLRPLTDYLGLDFSAARRRVARDPVLAGQARDVFITAADGKRYSLLCLPRHLLPGWLFGSRLAPGRGGGLMRGDNHRPTLGAARP